MLNCCLHYYHHIQDIMYDYITTQTHVNVHLSNFFFKRRARRADFINKEEKLQRVQHYNNDPKQNKKTETQKTRQIQTKETTKLKHKTSATKSRHNPMRQLMPLKKQRKHVQIHGQRSKLKGWGGPRFRDEMHARGVRSLKNIIDVANPWPEPAVSCSIQRKYLARSWSRDEEVLDY